jgi:tetratricopeptide (TPR) repeat protein
MQSLSELLPNDTEAAFYNTALDLITAHNLSEAARWLESALEFGNDQSRLWELLGLCRFSLGDFAAAQRAWRRNVAAGGVNSPSVRYLNRLTSAEFTEYIERFNACLDRAAQGQILPALLRLWPALENLPNLTGQNLAGLFLYQLGLKKSAARLWKQVLTQDRSNAAAIYYLTQGKIGFLPYWMEKAIWEVLLQCGKISVIMKFSG